MTKYAISSALLWSDPVTFSSFLSKTKLRDAQDAANVYGRQNTHVDLIIRRILLPFAFESNQASS